MALDLQKAFDRIPTEENLILWNVLCHVGVDRKVVQMIRKFYINLQRRFKIASQLGEPESHKDAN